MVRQLALTDAPPPSCAAVGCCVLAFSIGLLFVQRSGNYFVAMFDDYSATLPLLIVVILENIAIAWLYGIDKYVCCLLTSFFW